MKKTTEQQLIQSANILNKKLAIMEAAPAAPAAPANQNRDWSWQNVGKAAGNVWQGVKNTAGAVGDAATGAVNAVTGAASDLATGFNSAQTPATSAAKPTAPTNKWPTTPQEITAFQKANGLKVDGLIGKDTMQALAKQGIQPPAGFQMAGPKKAAPAKPSDPMAQSPEEAEDERIAQNQAFYNMSPEQQAMYNKGVAQQGQKPAAAPANAQTPATAPNAAAAAITPNFASQQAPAQTPAATPATAQTPSKAQNTAPNATPEELKAAKAAVAAYKPNPKAQPYDADYGTNVPGAPGTREYELVHPETVSPEPEATPTPKQEDEVITYNESAYPEMTRFKNLISVEEMFENVTEAQHVSFKQDDSLARIIQLSKKEIK